MSAKRSEFETAAVDAYKWACKSHLSRYSSLTPRTFQKLVDDYCLHKGKPTPSWKVGNGSRSLTSIISSIEDIKFQNGYLQIPSPHIQKTLTAPAKALAQPAAPTSSTQPKASLLTTTTRTKKPAPAPKPTVQAHVASGTVRAGLPSHINNPSSPASAPTTILRSIAGGQEALTNAVKKPKQTIPRENREKTTNDMKKLFPVFAAAKPAAVVVPPSNNEITRSNPTSVAHYMPPSALSGVEAPRNLVDSNSLKSSSPSVAACPVCSNSFPLAQIDSHLDSCLSEQAIAEGSMEQPEQPEPAPLQSSSSLKPPKRKSIEDEQALNGKKRSRDEVWDGMDDYMPNGAPLRKKSKSASNSSVGDIYTPNSGFDEMHAAMAYSGGSPPSNGNGHKSLVSKLKKSSTASSAIFPSKRKSSSPKRDCIILDSDGEDEEEAYMKAQRRSAYSATAENPSDDSDDDPYGETKRARRMILQAEENNNYYMAQLKKSAEKSSKSKQKISPKKSSIKGGNFSETIFKTTQDDKECPICFDAFEKGQLGIFLPCLCLYHEKCITVWFAKKPNNCPSHGDL